MASRRAQKALLLLLTAAWLQPCRCSEGACLPLADDLHSRMLRLQGLAEDTLGRLTSIIEGADDPLSGTTSGQAAVPEGVTAPGAGTTAPGGGTAAPPPYGDYESYYDYYDEGYDGMSYLDYDPDNDSHHFRTRVSTFTERKR